MSEYEFNIDDDCFQIAALATEQISPLTSPYTSLTSGLGASGSPGTYLGASGSNGTYSIGTAGSVFTTNGASNAMWTTSPYISTGSTPSIQVKGDAEFEGRVMINKRDLGEFMETLSKRLAILVPDPEKLEHFKALQKAYDHYKTLEALCELPESTDDK
jgi:hypothetical protein